MAGISVRIFIPLLIRVLIGLEFIEDYVRADGMRIPKEFDCSKHIWTANPRDHEKPTMSGRIGRYGIYTDSEGYSTHYSRMGQKEDLNDTFYFECSAKYPIVFGIMPGLEECEMSVALRENFQYHFRVFDNKGYLSTNLYAYSSWAKITGPPFIVGAFCHGICNDVDTEVYYIFNSYQITGTNGTVPVDNANFTLVKNDNIELWWDLMESTKLEALCLNQNHNNTPGLLIWKDLENVSLTMQFVALTLLTVGTLFFLIVVSLYLCFRRDHSSDGQLTVSESWVWV